MQPQTIVVLRHAHRHLSSATTFGNEQPLSRKGVKEAFFLGKQIADISWKEIHTSPLIRCVQTSEKLMEGTGRSIPMIRTNLLGDPGIFIDDPQKAGAHFLKRPWIEIAQEIAAKKKLPGIRSLKEGSQLFIDYTLKMPQFPSLMVSHDIIICLLCCYFFESTDVKKFVPGFLEGFSLSLDPLTICFRQERKSFSSVP
jgi:broad specificity phosphatase PhoE